MSITERSTKEYTCAARKDCSVPGGCCRNDDVINLLASSIQISKDIGYNIKKLEDRWQSPLLSGVLGNLWLYWSASFVGTSIIAFILKGKSVKNSGWGTRFSKAILDIFFIRICCKLTSKAVLQYLHISIVVALYGHKERTPRKIWLVDK